MKNVFTVLFVLLFSVTGLSDCTDLRPSSFFLVRLVTDGFFIVKGLTRFLEAGKMLENCVDD